MGIGGGAGLDGDVEKEREMYKKTIHSLSYTVKEKRKRDVLFKNKVTAPLYGKGRKQVKT